MAKYTWNTLLGIACLHSEAGMQNVRKTNCVSVRSLFDLGLDFRKFPATSPPTSASWLLNAFCISYSDAVSRQAHRVRVITFLLLVLLVPVLGRQAQLLAPLVLLALALVHRVRQASAPPLNKEAEEDDGPKHEVGEDADEGRLTLQNMPGTLSVYKCSYHYRLDTTRPMGINGWQVQD